MEPVHLNNQKLEYAGQDELALLNAFFILFRIASIVDQNNEGYQAQSAKFYRLFRTYTDSHGKLIIKIIEGRIFVDERLAKFNSDGIVRSRGIMDTWRRLGIGGMIIEEFLDQRMIDKLVYLIARTGLAEHSKRAVSERLIDLGIDGITLLSVEEEPNRTELTDDQRTLMRRAARVTFFRAIATVEDVMARAAEDKEIDISKTRRTVHSLIDQIVTDESTLLELTAIRDFDEYTFAHCTNVCVYALTMGLRLTMDRNQLSELGFAALFHDLGKVKLPNDLVRKPDVFDENDWVQMQKHPQLGAKTILRNTSFDRGGVRAAVAAFEHHINEDFTGYPKLHRERPTNLFSKIISIADTFDALTSGRVYIKKSLSPDEVLRKMMYQMTVKFDAFLLKLFVNIIGIYPPGTLVVLSTDELAVVMKNRQEDLMHPQVRVIGNRFGPLREFVDLDLAEPENASRRITRIIDPGSYGLDIKQIVLAD
ncbi:MAG: HD domain-containing protein [candidate division Zixibacteria bacterium]|nr:HD domain-containing protein [candidate division Zixibacteria bacterium]